MTIGNASETRLSYVAESTLGATPSSPSFQNLRFTGESFNIDREYITSNEVRADRNVSEMARVAGGCSGGFDFELSYGTLDSILESVMFGAWSTNVLKNGVTRKSFSVEKTLELGATDQYLRYAGMVADSFSLNVQAGQMVTGSVGFVGMSGSVGSSALSGATYTAANTKAVMNATSDFASLTAFALSPSPTIMGVSINVQNGLRQQRAVGNFNPVGIGSGRCEVTGEIEAYFEDTGLYQKYLDGTAGGLQFTLGSVTTEKYTINIPNMKLSDGEIVARGNDQDIMVRLPFQGLYDTSGSPANNATIIITRAVS